MFLVLELGKTVERNVGYARGWACDEPALVKGEIATRGDHNVWLVTGQRAGSTQCRVGTDPYGVSYVFNVRVVPRAAGHDFQNRNGNVIHPETTCIVGL
jgi:hypothetical protein